MTTLSGKVALITGAGQGVGRCELDVGRFVVILYSEDCRYVNGQSIAVDGGQAFFG